MPFTAPQPKKLTPKEAIESIQEDYKEIKKEEKKHDKEVMEEIKEKPKKERVIEKNRQTNNLKDIMEDIMNITQDVIRRYGDHRSSYVLEKNVPKILKKFNWKVIINSKGKKEVVDNESQ